MAQRIQSPGGGGTATLQSELKASRWRRTASCQRYVPAAGSGRSGIPAASGRRGWCIYQFAGWPLPKFPATLASDRGLGSFPGFRLCRYLRTTAQLRLLAAEMVTQRRCDFGLSPGEIQHQQDPQPHAVPGRLIQLCQFSHRVRVVCLLAGHFIDVIIPEHRGEVNAPICAVVSARVLNHRAS